MCLCVFTWWCVCSIICNACCIHHTMFVVPTTHCSLSTVTVLNIEHCVPLITS
nr:MAG TPA: hypothetical protein [Caudoviricetes sp.]